DRKPQDMLQGTLDVLILRTLIGGPAHGHTIAHGIGQRSEDILQVEHGSLYPALHRLEERGWIAAFWGTSENNRRARYYRLSAAGRKQLIAQTNRWEQLVRAIGRILRPAAEREFGAEPMSIRRVFHREQRDAERAAEHESHPQIETDRNIEAGMSPADARTAAYRKLGNPARIRETI